MMFFDRNFDRTVALIELEVEVIGSKLPFRFQKQQKGLISIDSELFPNKSLASAR